MLAQVVRELTDDERFSFHSIRRVEGTPAFEMFVTTSGIGSEPLPIQAASQGTLSVLVLFGQIFYFLKTLRPDTIGEAVLKVAGTVIIDELDAHLHPVWQQKLMGILTGSFPNVQFIVSAHSPLIVTGCDRNEVAVLVHVHETDRFRVELQPQDFLGAKHEDLYKQVFKVEEMDRLYLEYAARAAAGEGQSVEREIREITQIESRRSLTSAEQASLDKLNRDDRLLLRAQEVRARRLEDKASGARVQRLENEIERLKAELLKGGPAA